MFLTLCEIKKHLNLDDEFIEDDTYILSLATVAEEIIQKHIDCSLDNIVADNGGDLPAPLLQAMLLFIGNMYANRESIAYTNAIEIPFAYDYLLSLYKKY